MEDGPFFMESLDRESIRTLNLKNAMSETQAKPPDRGGVPLQGMY